MDPLAVLLGTLPSHVKCFLEPNVIVLGKIVWLVYPGSPDKALFRPSAPQGRNG
jgi:hypothetical protein